MWSYTPTSGLLRPSLEVSEKKKERKNNWPLLDLSASPQVKSNTPLIFAIHAGIPISFYVLKDEGLRFCFLKKKFEIFF